MCIDRTNSVHSCKIYVLQICENRKLQHTTDYIQSRWSCFSTQRQSQAIHVYSTGSCTRVGLEVVQMCAHWQPKTQQWSFDHLSAHVDQGKKWPDTTPDTHHYYNCVSAIVRPSVGPIWVQQDSSMFKQFWFDTSNLRALLTCPPLGGFRSLPRCGDRCYSLWRAAHLNRLWVNDGNRPKSAACTSFIFMHSGTSSVFWTSDRVNMCKS